MRSHRPSLTEQLDDAAINADIAKEMRAVDKQHKAELAERDETIRSLRSRVEWQPIETAPKDGTWLLLYWPMTRTNVIVAGHYYRAKDLEEMWWSLPRVDSNKQPTHWMPLPSPPLQDVEGESKP